MISASGNRDTNTKKMDKNDTMTIGEVSVGKNGGKK